MLTQERLKELLHYCPDMGVFTWRIAVGRVRVGSVAGNVSKGYVQISVDNKNYLAHRLAWLYIHGEFPPRQLDHINRVRADNRICNLRLATNAENHQNLSLSRRNTSGHIGVRWFKQRKKWHAQIKINRKQLHIGYFTDLSEAIAARKSAELKFHTFQNA